MFFFFKSLGETQNMSPPFFRFYCVNLDLFKVIYRTIAFKPRFGNICFTFFQASKQQIQVSLAFFKMFVMFIL